MLTRHLLKSPDDLVTAAEVDKDEVNSFLLEQTIEDVRLRGVDAQPEAQHPIFSYQQERRPIAPSLPPKANWNQAARLTGVK